MGLSVLNQPAAAGGGIKSVQRGSAGGAGNVTITAVDITKSFVNIFGTTSSGTVAAAGSLSGGLNTTSTTIVGTVAVRTGGGQFDSAFRPSNANGLSGASVNSSNWNTEPAWTQTANINASNFSSANITGGSNNLVAAVVQGFLANSTTLTVSGACRYEVVEFN